MPTLYTVNFKRKRFVTRYDMKGRVIEQTEEWVEETMRDLPLVTAQHFVDKTGGMITAQYEQEFERKPLYRGRVKFEYQKDEAPRSRETRKIKRAEAPVTPITKPADYSDLVNVLMENGE